MAHDVTLRPAALGDLTAIYNWVANQSDPATAQVYRERLLAACTSLQDFPSRGSMREDLAPGVRTISFEGRAVIAYLVGDGAVDILRIFHHGRDVSRAFSDDDPG